MFSQEQHPRFHQLVHLSKKKSAQHVPRRSGKEAVTTKVRAQRPHPTPSATVGPLHSVPFVHLVLQEQHPRKADSLIRSDVAWLGTDSSLVVRGRARRASMRRRGRAMRRIRAARAHPLARVASPSLRLGRGLPNPGASSMRPPSTRLAPCWTRRSSQRRGRARRLRAEGRRAASGARPARRLPRRDFSHRSRGQRVPMQQSPSRLLVHHRQCRSHRSRLGPRRWRRSKPIRAKTKAPTGRRQTRPRHCH